MVGDTSSGLGAIDIIEKSTFTQWSGMLGGGRAVGEEVTNSQPVGPLTIVRENVRNTAKSVKSHDFLNLEKNVKNVEVIGCMPIILNTMVTTLNQFCLSHDSKAIIF